MTPPEEQDRLTVIARCPGRFAGQPCSRRAAHHGACATGGSYAAALDERDDALQQLRGAVDLIRDLAEMHAPESYMTSNTEAAMKSKARAWLREHDAAGGQ